MSPDPGAPDDPFVSLHAETAQALDVALTTVRTHLAHIFDKTGTSRQAELVRLAPPSAPL
jgi:DNA-binding CsgD family transcriptional regulator